MKVISLSVAKAGALRNPSYPEGQRPSSSEAARTFVGWPFMNIVIGPYRETDRSALEALTVAAFDGVSIDQNFDRLLGPIAGRDWAWRKTQHVAFDIDTGAEGMTIAQIETTEQNAIGCHLYPALGFREVARKFYYAMPLGDHA
jgi:hypothetical protein